MGMDIQRDFLKNTMWNFLNVAGQDVVNPTHRVSVYIALVDVEKELERLGKEKKRLEGEIKRGEGMLGNPKFVEKAPEEKVNEEKNKLAKYKETYAQVCERIAALQ